MLEKLGYDGKRIFGASVSSDKKVLVLYEACDMCYETTLTKAEVTELANDFLKLADQMED